MSGGERDMEEKNIKDVKREKKKDWPSETDIDYENDNDETLKKYGRQVEV